MGDDTHRRLAAIVSADVVGYSRLMGTDEAGTHARLKARYTEFIEPKISQHDGRVVKLMGDGLLAEFPSAVSAVAWAVELQQKFSQIDPGQNFDERIDYRVGVNLGDVIVAGDDIFGDGVNVAARLQEAAEPGGICISDKVHAEVAGKLEVRFMDGGAQAMKNIAQAIQVWRWSPDDQDSQRNIGQDETQNTASVASTNASVDPTIPDKASIAVLPLDCMSDSREHEYLADGMTEDIITLLARIPNFFVIARNSSFSYKGQNPNITQVGWELGVRYVVESSLRPVGDRLRVTVQLIEAASGNHIWAERFDADGDNLFDVQDEITTAIVARLEPELTRAEFELMRRRPLADLDAWDYF